LIYRHTGPTPAQSIKTAHEIEHDIQFHGLFLLDKVFANKALRDG